MKLRSRSLCAILGGWTIGTLALVVPPPAINITQILDIGDVRVTGVQNYVARDLGFSGKIGSTILNTYGDTCHSRSTSWPAGRDEWSLGGFAANSVAIGNLKTPLKVSQKSTQIQTVVYSKTFNYTTPLQFCQYFPNETPVHAYGMGITSIQDVDGVHGLLFFMKLYRPGNGTLWMMGGGIAKVDNSKAGFPTCTRIGQSFWDGQTMPWYGTYATVSQQGVDSDGNSYIYSYGQSNITRFGPHIYLARVPRNKAFKYSAFTYWNGTGWQKKPLSQPQPSQAILEYLPSPTSTSSAIPSKLTTITTALPSTTIMLSSVSPTSIVLSPSQSTETSLSSISSESGAPYGSLSDTPPQPTAAVPPNKRQASTGINSSTTSDTSATMVPTSTPTNGTTPSSSTIPNTRPFVQSGQGSMYWSPYHRAYLMFEAYNNNIFAPANGVQIRSSYAPEGPWSAPVKVVQFNQSIPSISGGSITIPLGIYAPAVQPWYDPTGRTVYLTFTYNASVQRVLKLTFA